MPTTPSPAGFDFRVRRDALDIVEIAPLPAPADVEIQDGEVVLAVDAFSFTANNVTYGLLGDAFHYWDFFPAPEGWGHIPVWGFADVVRSRCDGVAVGERFYGYLPMATHLVVRPGSVGPAGFSDTSAHRSERAAVYNRYTNTAGDPGYDPAAENEQMLLRPLFATAFLIDDLLAEHERFGASVVVLGSASSKTAYSTAFLLAQRGDAEVVGLTSPGNVGFVERLGWYDHVLAYDDIELLDPEVPTAYVDMSGDAAVRGAVHRHLMDALTHDLMVGMTHKDDLGGDPDLPGVAPVLFFAPDRAAKRAADWGPLGLEERLAQAWAPLRAAVSDPGAAHLRIAYGKGPEAAERLYREVLTGTAAPDAGIILSL